MNLDRAFKTLAPAPAAIGSLQRGGVPRLMGGLALVLLAVSLVALPRLARILPWLAAGLGGTGMAWGSPVFMTVMVVVDAFIVAVTVWLLVTDDAGPPREAVSA